MASTHLAEFRAARHRAVCACAFAPSSLGALLSAHAGAGELASCGAMPADQMVADCDVVAAGGELQREYGGRAATMSTPLGNAVCGHSRVYLREFLHPAYRMAAWHLVNASHVPYERQLLGQELDEQKDYLLSTSGLRDTSTTSSRSASGAAAEHRLWWRWFVPCVMLLFSTTLDRQA